MTTPASSSPAAQPPDGPAQHGPAQPGAAPGRRGWRAVSIVLVGAFMALLDTTIVNVALPSIRTRPARVIGEPGMDRLRLRACLRPGSGAWRPGGRPVRAQAAVPHRADHLHPGQRRLRHLAAPGSDRRGPDRAGPGRRPVLPLDQRDDPALVHRARPGPRRSACSGAVIGVSTAIGPLLGGLIIAGVGATTGGAGCSWSTCSSARWPSRWPPGGCPPRRRHTRRGFDPVGLGLLDRRPCSCSFPLVEGEQDGWPAWTWICFGCCVVAFAAARRLGAARGQARRRPAAQAGPAAADLVLGRRDLRASRSSAASAASSSRCRSCGRWAWATPRWSPAW